MRGRWARIFVTAIGLAVVAAACGDSDSTATTIDPNRVFTVVYEITGDQASADLSYTFAGGDDVFRGTEPLPFERTFDMNAGDLVDLGAASVEGSSVTCRILIDGVLYRENTGEGGNVAVCQGTVADGP